MATAAVVSKLAGNWGISVGQKSGADDIDFSPKSIASGSKTTFKFTSLWNCASTDNGTYKADLPMHRMRMALRLSPIPRLRRVLPHEWGRVIGLAAPHGAIGASSP